MISSNHFILLGLILGLVLTLSSNVEAQVKTDNKFYYRESIGEVFTEVQTTMEDFFQDKDKGKGSGYKQWKRWEADMMDRQNPDGTVSDISKILMKAKKHNEKNFGDQADSRSLNGLWEGLGPSSYTQTINVGSFMEGTGRLNCIAFHETDPNTFFVGAPAGGLWKTTDGGTTWEPKMQGLSQIGISGIGVDGGDVFVLTGDGDGFNTSSTGVYKSTNGGETFTLLPLPWGAGETVWGYKLLIHPTFDDTFYIATTTGLYVTENDGDDWDLLYDGVVFDVEIQPSDPNNIIISGRDVGGNAWITQQTATSGGFIAKDYLNNNSTRIEIAVSAADPDIGYILEGSGLSSPFRFGGFTRWNNADITNKTNLTNTPNIMSGSVTGQSSGSQHNYDIAMIVNPNDEDDILTGGVNIWGSTNGGSSWASVAHGNYQAPLPDNSIVHVDIHALEINPVDGKLYTCTDGGVNVSSDFGDTWTQLSNGLSNMQIYRMDGIDENYFSMGLQDMGSFVLGLDGDGFALGGGDGMDTKINPSFPDSLYYSNQNGNLRFTPNKGTTATTRTPPGATGGTWTTPIDILTDDFNTIYTGYQTNFYWSTDTGQTWNSAAPGIGTANFRFIYAEETSTTVYAASNKKIFSSPVSGMSSTSFTDITYDLSTPLAIAGVNITSITKRGGSTYVTLSGGSATNKVFFLNDGTTSWGNITYNLPNVSINCIAGTVDGGNNVNYVGTDAGVYRRTTGESSWSLFNTGMPFVRVNDLELDATNKVLHSATFGRGIFRTGLYGDCPSNEFLTAENGISTNAYIKASNTIESTRVLFDFVIFDTEVIYQGGQKVILKPGFNAKEGVFFKATSDKDCSYVDPDS